MNVELSTQNSETSRYADALDQVLAYGEAHNYSGYSKFDALNSPFLSALSLGVGPIQWALAQSVYRFPVNIRPLLGVKKGRNAKGIGLFALAYLLQSRASPQHAEQSIAKARELLNWLMENQSKGFHGACWGYNHRWPNFRFSVPANSPNLVVTGNVIISFLEAYEQLGDSRYLEIAQSSIDFIRRDLNTIVDTPTKRAISYVPGSQWIVLNNQGLAAVVMAWVSRHTNDNELRELARRHIHFLAHRQTDYGAWFYADPPGSSPVKHDNYHTGNVLDWLLLYRELTGDNTYASQFERGIEFYRDHLFTRNGAPKHRHDVRLPYNIHGCAQGVITFCRAAQHGYPQYFQDAKRVLNWALDNLRAADGHFFYQKGRLGLNRTPLMRWNQAWMAVALAYARQTHHLMEE